MHRREESGILVDDLYDWVHVNEKWFYLLKDRQGVYLHPIAEPPTAQDKHCITKVAFLAAVTRLRKLSNGDVVQWENQYLVNQLDRAKSHPEGGIMEATEEVGGDDIVVEIQSPNSPDINVNDLGFFHSIQQLKEDLGMTNEQEQVEATTEVLDVYPWKTLERVWQSLFAIYGEVLV
ncbi:unnamed protein product [Choristocarpus tenellus]